MLKASDTMDVNTCLTFCTGYNYAGLEYGYVKTLALKLGGIYLWHTGGSVGVETPLQRVQP